MTTSTLQTLERPEETTQAELPGTPRALAADVIDWDVVDVMDELLSLET